jgi:hypothetical protein
MPKNKSVSSFNQSGSIASLSLSELHERKAGLEREHQWLLKQIKRKRTELKNFRDRMQSIAKEQETRRRRFLAGIRIRRGRRNFCPN